MESLRAFIYRYVRLTDAEITQVLTHFHVRPVDADSVILQYGQIANEFCYVEKGGFRMVNPLTEPETTVWAVFDDAYLCQLPSFFTQTPSKLFVQAAEDSRIWSISYADMEQLYRQVPAWQTFGRKLWEETLIQFIDVAISLQNDPAALRYEKFTTDRRMAQRLSLKHLASILGITPFTLSRLRRKK